MVIDPGNNIGPSGVPIEKARQSSTQNKVEARYSQVKNTAKPASDEVSLSTQGQTLQRLESAISTLPDVDQGKIEALRSAIENGHYEVNSQKLAQKLLEQEQWLPATAE